MRYCLFLCNDGGAGGIMILHATSLMCPMVQEEIKKTEEGYNLVLE